MREIKLIAWDRESKKMRKDVLIDGDGNVFCDDVNDRNEQWNRKVDWVVLEYTGLKDKNGKEIYEGYVCKSDLQGIGHIVEVIFNDGGFKAFDKNFRNIYLHNWVPSCLEIIGNIYENPELLVTRT